MTSIRDSIVSKLATTFPDHTIYDEKVLQGLKRPCFFVDLIPIDIVKVSPNRQDRSMIVDIQYMSLEDTKTKNLETAELLGQLFSVVEFNNFRVSVSNERYEMLDGILHYLFDLDFILIGGQTETEPNMGEFILNKEVQE